jgi:hypothetical protein
MSALFHRRLIELCEGEDVIEVLSVCTGMIVTLLIQHGLPASIAVESITQSMKCLDKKGLH